MADTQQHDIVGSVTHIWLDDTIETTNRSQATATKIREIVKGGLRTFADRDQCLDYITSDDITQKIYLIVSNKLGQYLVPLIYDLPQIEGIYIYCGNQQAAESWSKSYSKVRKIFIKEKPLLEQIRADLQSAAADNAIPMSAFHLQEQGNSLHKLSPESAKFMWYRVAMSVLLMMAQHFNPKDEMADEARKQYQTDEFEKKRIDTFIETYQTDKAFWWYTSNSFVYRLLNRALRLQDIDIIFKFRFIINELHHQIEELHRKYLNNPNKANHLTLYRGQLMSMKEVEFLRNNVNQMISMNTFLSTSQSSETAKRFLNFDNQPTNTSEQSVLFTIEVEVNDTNRDTAAFAFIAEHSCNPDEDEVLFTINAIFKVESFEQKEHIWHVGLQLIRQQNEQQKDFSRYLIKSVEKNPTPTVFGWFLYRMNDFDSAERYVHYIIQKHLDVPERAAAFNLLGLLYKDRKVYPKAIEYYIKAIEIYGDTDRFNSPQIISIHHNLSLAYLADEDVRLAEGTRRKVAELLADVDIQKTPMLIAMSKTLEGRLAVAFGDNKKALKDLEAGLHEKRKILLPNDPSIAALLHEMGLLHVKIGNDTEALACFQQAVHISEQCLLDNDLDLAKYLADLGRIRFKRKEYHLALEQFEKALKTITDSTREDEEIITELLKCIQETKDIILPLSREE